MPLNKNKIFVSLYFITIKECSQRTFDQKTNGPFRMSFLHKVDAHFALLLFYVARSIVVIHHNLDENVRSLEKFFGVLMLLVIDGKALEYLCF